MGRARGQRCVRLDGAGVRPPGHTAPGSYSSQSDSPEGSMLLLSSPGLSPMPVPVSETTPSPSQEAEGGTQGYLGIWKPACAANLYGESFVPGTMEGATPRRHVVSLTTKPAQSSQGTDRTHKTPPDFKQHAKPARRVLGLRHPAGPPNSAGTEGWGHGRRWQQEPNLNKQQT